MGLLEEILGDTKQSSNRNADIAMRMMQQRNSPPAPNVLSAGLHAPVVKGSSAKGGPDAWISQALSILGLNDAKYHGFVKTTAQKESSLNPRAINRWDSNARAGHPSMGFMQTIRGTFDSNKLAGHNDIFNPVDNIIAAIRYAQKRYGGIDKIPGIVSMSQGGKYRGY